MFAPISMIDSGDRDIINAPVVISVCTAGVFLNKSNIYVFVTSIRRGDTGPVIVGVRCYSAGSCIVERMGFGNIIMIMVRCNQSQSLKMVLKN